MKRLKNSSADLLSIAITLADSISMMGDITYNNNRWKLTFIDAAAVQAARSEALPRGIDKVSMSEWMVEPAEGNVDWIRAWETHATGMAQEIALETNKRD